MTTRRITPYKGGRTARIPSGWILPETLRRIHEAKRERGVSFSDLIEEQYGTQGDEPMTDGEMFNRLGIEADTENVQEFYGGMSEMEILKSMNESWPHDDNEALAEKVFEYCNS